MSQLNFASFPLRPEIIDNLNNLGYRQMTSIQASSLGPILNGRDVLAQAKTGSGKTASFAIGLLTKLNLRQKKPQALVICPTRELADQVAKEIRKLARMLPNIKVLSLCGGTPIGPQIGSLAHGAHCIVGTPGRIEDHLKKRTLSLQGVHTLVLDEADRMLDMGFSDVIEKIISCTPNHRQTLLFSATYPADIADLSSNIQKTPLLIKLTETQTKSDIKELYFKTKHEHKVQLLLRVLGHYSPASTIIFCNTKKQCQEVADELQENSYCAKAIHGDLDQYERDQVLTLFANKSLSILVATDVAARGIDIDDLKAVVNYEISRDPAIHLHRIGRTGRAGKKGMAFNLSTEQDKLKIENIVKMSKAEASFEDLNILPAKSVSMLTPPMRSLQISGGKKNKLRPTDILGALTRNNILSGDAVGKINIFDFYSIVAVKRSQVQQALKALSGGKIKGKLFKVKTLEI